MPTFIGSRGRIFHDNWQPDDPVRGAVVLLHGYGEHLGLYEAFARRLIADGLAVHAMDAVGHGRSDGERVPCGAVGRCPHPAGRSAASRSKGCAMASPSMWPEANGCCGWCAAHPEPTPLERRCLSWTCGSWH